MKIKVTDQEREEFRKILPTGFAKVVSARLNEAGVQPARAKEYYPKIISDVMAGHQSDFNVVLELYRFKDEILTKESELNALKNKEYHPEQ